MFIRGKVVSDLMYLLFFSAAKSEGQVEELKRLQSKLDQQTEASAREQGNLKKTLSDVEGENER